jgi:hypothetical protein
MHLAYPKLEVWIIIYEFIMTARIDVKIDGIPPPVSPCSEVWSMLSDRAKKTPGYFCSSGGLSITTFWRYWMSFRIQIGTRAEGGM